jgi:DNA-binding transcriptional regulator YbjK
MDWDFAKERIIPVAEILFTRQRFDGASMRDIAAEAEIQPASMYYYFPSKDENAPTIAAASWSPRSSRNGVVVSRIGN